MWRVREKWNRFPQYREFTLQVSDLVDINSNTLLEWGEVYAQLFETSWEDLSFKNRELIISFWNKTS